MNILKLDKMMKILVLSYRNDSPEQRAYIDKLHQTYLKNGDCTLEQNAVLDVAMEIILEESI